MDVLVGSLGIRAAGMLVALVGVGAGRAAEAKPGACGPCRLARAAKEHMEDVASAIHTYEVEMGGTLDEFNTASYPQTYGGHMRLASKFQPNEYLVVENTGDVDVVNPQIVVNGRRNWFSADDILAGVLREGMSEAEKAMAIWGFCGSMEVQAHDNNRRVGPPFPGTGSETDNEEASHPSRNAFKERANPVKAANCYYCSGCSLSAANFVILCRHAGLTARAVWMSALNTFQTHCVGMAWYDGGWHLFDPERRAFFLGSDNTTVASYAAIHKHPALESRTHNGGFASKGMPPHAGDYGRYYPPHVMPVEQWLSRLELSLRPGETLIYRWDRIGKYRYGDNVRKRDQLVPYQLANGKLIYRPRLGGAAYRRGIVSDLNMVPASGREGKTALHPEVVEAPATGGKTIVSPPAWVIWKICSPYPIVGALVGGTFHRKTDGDVCRIWVSVHDGDWTEVYSAKGTGRIEGYASVDAILNPRATHAVYDYYVKFELRAKATPADASLLEAYMETDLQMAATALPSLSAGENRVLYRDESSPARRVRLTHGWHESSATRPPEAPASPVSPGDGETIGLAAIKTLQWQGAKDPDGGKIADYHLQVSPRADMLYPVSPNFDRLTFSGEQRWKVPQGWLVAGRSYYWRVRARDVWGAWSGWGPVWRFSVSGQP